MKSRYQFTRPQRARLTDLERALSATRKALTALRTAHVALDLHEDLALIQEQIDDAADKVNGAVPALYARWKGLSQAKETIEAGRKR